MKYTYDVKDEFPAGFATLPIWFPEETLDALEALLLAPEKLIVRPGYESAYYDFTRQRDGIIHYIFLIIDPDHVSRVLVLRRLGHVERPQPKT